MSGLEIAFYIVGIIFMGLSLLILIGILVISLIIRSKLQAINESIHEKLELANRIAAIATPIYSITKQILRFRRMLRR